MMIFVLSDYLLLNYALFYTLDACSLLWRDREEVNLNEREVGEELVEVERGETVYCIMRKEPMFNSSKRIKRRMMVWIGETFIYCL